MFIDGKYNGKILRHLSRKHRVDSVKSVSVDTTGLLKELVQVHTYVLMCIDSILLLIQRQDSK